MTRYQMIKHIQAFLENYDKSSVHFGRKKDQAFELLNLIESLGMLPPITMRYVDRPEGNILCSEVCEWEPE